MGSARPCPVPDCEKSIATRQGWCEDHSHDWVVAAEVPVEHRRAAGALRRRSTMVQEDTFVRVMDVYCSRCKRTFSQVQASRQPCDPYAEHLRGGPIGDVRRRQPREDECDPARDRDAQPVAAVQSGP
jgi:hypothetical protein